MEGAYAMSRALVCDVMKYLVSRGLVSIMAGNVSWREGRWFWITPSSYAKDRLTPSDLVCIDIETGDLIWGFRKPSIETEMHRRIYLARSDARWVVHAHCYTFVSLIEKSFDVSKLLKVSEEGEFIGKITVIERVKPGSLELAEAIAHAVSSGYDVVVLKGHGIVALDPYNGWRAAWKAEFLEAAARCIASMGMV